MFAAMMTDLLDMATATAWMADGLCSQTDPEEFFPDTGESSDAAKQVCRDCPVRERCLEYALAEGIEFGVWGGLTASERAKRLDLAA
ncbi:WhiB family transcriptional regulator [Nonomuraea sp. NPDC049714]|uniref:WhiB family transcriptional regulator n=1 Tax=Nonomuraea sp. NPDC049714 TaxID=3364357 RepID=UPI0037BAF5B0